MCREVPRHVHHGLRAHAGEEVRDQLREELPHHLQTHGKYRVQKDIKKIRFFLLSLEQSPPPSHLQSPQKEGR